MKHINYDRLIELIERHELNIKSRKREIVYKRSCVANFLRKFEVPYIRIGLLLGGKDHATMIHAIKCYEMNHKYTDFKAYVGDIEEELKQCIKGQRMQLTDLENELINCTTLRDLVNVRKKILSKV